MEPLPDPLNDRGVNTVLPPPQLPLSREKLFPQKNIPDYKLLKDHLAREGKLHKSDFLDLINIFISTVKQEPNILKIQDPVTLVGDIHGQYYDLIKLFEVGGSPEETKYLFLGDYVDRGNFSVECVILLFSMKLNYKDTFFMLRGNHECRQLTSFFNFKEECESKYDIEIYERIMESFDTLPLASIVNEKFICVHGGISPSIKNLSDIKSIDRFQEPPKEGAFCDILWSDPCEDDNEAILVEWNENTTRGCSYIFGLKATTPFLDKNDLICIIRAHEAQLDGYKMYNWDISSDFPAVITLFSAPNYCDVYNNKGAVMKFVDNSVDIQQFNYSPHPYILPNFMNLFDWSVPFISEKISEMLLHIVKKEQVDDDKGNKDITATLRMKLKFCIMMFKMYKTLREDNELIMKLKGFCPDNKIPKGLLLEGRTALKSAMDYYKNAKQLDLVNEKRPNNYK